MPFQSFIGGCDMLVRILKHVIGVDYKILFWNSLGEIRKSREISVTSVTIRPNSEHCLPNASTLGKWFIQIFIGTSLA